jgi:hypothetical protein
MLDPVVCVLLLATDNVYTFCGHQQLSSSILNFRITLLVHVSIRAVFTKFFFIKTTTTKINSITMSFID